MNFTLHILPGALYTRRVLIYLHEKNLLQSPLLTISPPLRSNGRTSSASILDNNTLPPSTAILKPKGSLPSLTTPEGTTIHGSLAIISYFEDLYDSTQSSLPHIPGTEPESPVNLELEESNFTTEAKPSMRGRTPEERTRNNEIIALVDEATTLFETAARNGSAMFTPLQKQDIATSKTALESCRAVLAKVDGFYLNERTFDVANGRDPREACVGVTVADIILFSLLEFALGMYIVDLTRGLGGLHRFHEEFKKRDSVLLEGGEGEIWDAKLRMLASYWVEETDGVWPWVCERAKIGGLYLKVLGGMAWKALKTSIG